MPFKRFHTSTQLLPNNVILIAIGGRKEKRNNDAFAHFEWAYQVVRVLFLIHSRLVSDCRIIRKKDNKNY